VKGDYRFITDFAPAFNDFGFAVLEAFIDTAIKPEYCKPASFGCVTETKT
jgi:hypothetical protein